MYEWKQMTIGWNEEQKKESIQNKMQTQMDFVASSVISRATPANSQLTQWLKCIVRCTHIRVCSIFSNFHCSVFRTDCCWLGFLCAALYGLISFLLNNNTISHWRLRKLKRFFPRATRCEQVSTHCGDVFVWFFPFSYGCVACEVCVVCVFRQSPRIHTVPWPSIGVHVNYKMIITPEFLLKTQVRTINR